MLTRLCDTRNVDATTSPVLLGQLTDTHVTSSADDVDHYVDNNGRLATAVDAINAESPRLDAVLVTGDMTDTGHAEAYETLAYELGRLDAIVLPLPGNHDCRSGVRSTFPDAGWVDAEHASWVHEIAGVRVIGLDSVRPGHDGAAFDHERDEFLRSVLATEFDGTTILAMHHPPFATGIDWMDRAGFVGLDLFTAALSAHPGVVAKIVCGHVHRSATATVAGVSAQIGISTVQHVALDLEPCSKPSLVRDPVGYQIHRVDASGIVTHARFIDTGEAPFVPDWADDYDPDARNS